MNRIYDTSILKGSRTKIAEIIRKNGLYDVDVSVLVKTLTPEEAIGTPGRMDFPIIIGKERVIEAKVFNAKAHAFTDSPEEFIGKLKKILDLPLKSNRERAIYIASLNAVLKYLNLIDKTIHCKDNDPGNCAKEIAFHILKKVKKTKVGLFGLNPAIAEVLVETFDVENVKITDLYKQNVNTLKYGVRIWDGSEMTEELIRKSEIILLTGTTFINGTFDYIMKCIKHYGKDYIVYGVTGAGICKLMNLKRICPFGKNE